MGNYQKQRVKVKCRFIKIMTEVKKLFFYGSIVDSWAPEIVLTPFVGLQWRNNPVWLRTIAPPSCGKSEHFSLIEDSELAYTIDVFSPKSFISGFRSQEGKDPSVIPQLDGKVVIISDESTLMEQSEKDRNEVQSLLRRIYDGKMSKKFGNMEEKQEYTSHFNLLIGSTPSIDRYFQYNQSLGERYINIRMQIPNKRALTTFATNNLYGEFKQDKTAIKKLFCEFIRNLPDVELEELRPAPKYCQLLDDCAHAIALIRTHINREKQSKNVSVVPEQEAGARLGKQMHQFAIADCVVNGDKEVSMKHVEKAIYIGLSSVKSTIIFVLYHVIAREKLKDIRGDRLWFTAIELAVLSGFSRSTIEYILEDLAIHRIFDMRVSKSGVGAKFQYRLTEDARHLFIDLALFNNYVPPMSKILEVDRAKKIIHIPPKDKIKV